MSSISTGYNPIETIYEGTNTLIYRALRQSDELWY